ncbi:borealin isoform X2 [Salmo salar]|uniref:Borealin isoform X2 n=1 Tax=Salmo salar TaxID=8030 RepID=A0A1S3M3F5_SALSA|nr:borealin-like isoform X2 [Salmo salar]|eukprot:XP_013997439.1 PREDICTED: borealin-like isoform X2 [Salmo salar]
MGRPKRTTKQRKNPKLDKLEAFLEDFDSEVKTVVERLKERTNSLLKDADNIFNMAVIKLPKAVRQMNWLEHCGSEKPKSPVEDAKKVEEAAQVESIMAEVHTIPPKTAKKAMSKSGEARTSSEDEENTIMARGKKGKSTRKPLSKRAEALSVSKQNTSIKKTSRKPLVTPSRNMLDSSLMGPTPLITPRFDSWLPKTPATRIPRHKERVYSISVNGSPISEGGNDIVINVPVGNGASIQLLASQMDTVDLGQLDETAVRSIRLLQNRLTTLCGTSE